jgi:EamA domain-containing membrane protein RarD
MVNAIQLAAVVLAGILVGIADALIKKTALTGSFWSALKNPLMIIILLLYIGQIILFVYVFSNHWNLGIVGNLQMVFYSLTVVLSGLIFFGEGISLIQGIGIGFALIGIILMNLY